MGRRKVDKAFEKPNEICDVSGYKNKDCPCPRHSSGRGSGAGYVAISAGSYWKRPPTDIEKFFENKKEVNS